MNETTRKIGTVLMTTLFMMGTFMALAPGEANAQILPEIDVRASGSVVLDVSPTGTGMGEVTLTVSNLAMDGSVKVRVSTTAAGYQVAPQYVTITIPPASEKSFPVVIVSNLRSPYQMRSASVHAEVTHFNSVPIEGTSSADTGFLILSDSYGKVILQSDKPFQKVSPGKQYPFKLKVLNVGNGIDTFSVEVLNKDKLNKEGFSISLSSTTTKNTDSQAYDYITIQIQTPREFGWKNEYHNLDLKATSEVEGQSSEYSITIWVNGFGVAGFEPLYSIVALAVVGSIFMKRNKD